MQTSERRARRAARSAAAASGEACGAGELTASERMPKMSSAGRRVVCVGRRVGVR